MSAERSFKVADWTVEPSIGRISRGSDRVALRPQVMELLVFLAKRNDGVATTGELLETLWAGKYVSEGTLYNCVGELRSALGADREYVRTIPRKGYQLVAPVTGAGEHPPARRSTAFSTRIAAILAIAAIAGLGMLLWSGSGDVGLDSAFSPPANSIAVLPLDDVSAAGANQYLGDGIAEALIHQLAQLPDLTVIARTSSFSFRRADADVPTIARALNVALLLEGSVQIDGDALRVYAQLIDARSGAHVWSQRFDRELSDLFPLQDEIAVAVANQLASAPVVVADLPYSATASPAPIAYELYMQGQYQLNTLFAPAQPNTNMDAPDRALDFFRRATEVDPNFALAWAGRARAMYFLVQMEKVAPDVAGPHIEQYLSRALEVGAGLAEVQFTAGILRQGEAALSHLERAIRINPNYSAAHVQRADMLLRQDRHRDAFESMRTAAKLDPLNGQAVEGALYASFYEDDLDDIDARIDWSNRLWPEANGLATEAHLMFETGRFERFPDLEKRARSIDGFGVTDWFGSVPRHFGDTYLTLGFTSHARRWLANPDMVASYDDVVLTYEERYDEARAFLRAQGELARDRPLHAYRWFPDIVASMVETYLYEQRYEELVAFFSGLGWPSGLYPLPNCCQTNPPWPEVAYAFALFETGDTEEAERWLASLVGQMERRIAEGVRVPNHYYELARLRVMQGRIADAHTAIATAIDLGWRRWYFERDPILAPLRQRAEFGELEARYDADIRRSRELVAAQLPLLGSGNP